MPSHDGFFDASAREGGSIPPAGARYNDRKVSDIVLAYCKRWGLHVIKGKLHDNTLSPLLPYIIMDCAYSEFTREIKPLKLRHKENKMRNDWLASYRKFNGKLFSALNQEQTDFVIDLMDEYEGKIDYDVMLMKVALMNLLKGLEFTDQKIMASLLVCNIIAQVAQDAWGKGNCNLYGKRDENHELKQMRVLSRKLTDTIVLLPEHLDLNEDEAVNSAVNKYIGTTIKYLYSYDRQ